MSDTNEDLQSFRLFFIIHTNPTMNLKRLLLNQQIMPMISSVISFIQATVCPQSIVRLFDDHFFSFLFFLVKDPSPIYNRIRDSGYETTSSSIDHQQHCFDQSSPSNVSLSADGQMMTVTYFSPSSIPMHHDLSLSTSNTLSRTLTTFSPIPVINESSSSSGMINARLAEQEIIEV